MITVPGELGRDFCDRHLKPSRRDILKVGGASMLGFSLGSMFEAQAAAAQGGAAHGGGPGWGKAKNIITGGLMWAVLDMEDRWHVFFNQKNGPLGNEVETLEAVMNRSETIDVQFYLRNPGWKNPSRSSYALWIEEVGAPELNLEDVKELTGKPAEPKKPGAGFFGIPIE